MSAQYRCPKCGESQYSQWRLDRHLRHCNTPLPDTPLPYEDTSVSVPPAHVNTDLSGGDGSGGGD